MKFPQPTQFPPSSSQLPHVIFAAAVALPAIPMCSCSHSDNQYHFYRKRGGGERERERKREVWRRRWWGREGWGGGEEEELKLMLRQIPVMKNTAIKRVLGYCCLKYNRQFKSERSGARRTKVAGFKSSALGHVFSPKKCPP